MMMKVDWVWTMESTALSIATDAANREITKRQDYSPPAEVVSIEFTSSVQQAPTGGGDIQYAVAIHFRGEPSLRDRKD
jgi:hypothetical protein